MCKLFGTDGVRGVANETLTPELALNLGKAGSFILKQNIKAANNFIIIGKDTRLSGDMLETALSAGICSTGVNVWNIGVAPTPIVAWLVKKYQALAGIVISASHNPAKDNGIKFFDLSGKKLSDELEAKIEQLINSGLSEISRPIAKHIGRIHYKPDIITAYMAYLEDIIDLAPENQLKVGIDTANGANSFLARRVYENLGIDTKIINNQPDGNNINLNCGSTNLEALQELVRTEKLDLGIAFDGDADRMLAVDHLGNTIDGDQIMYILTKYLPVLADNQIVVATVMSNIGFELAIKNMDKQFIRANVGDRYVAEELTRTGAKLGGEQSGHLIFPELNSTGDGLLSSLMLIKAILNSKKSLYELSQELNLFPQTLINVNVSSKVNWDKNPSIQKKINEYKNKLGNKGRILVRPSGTEPKIRVMVEGDNDELIQEAATKIAESIKAELS